MSTDRVSELGTHRSQALAFRLSTKANQRDVHISRMLLHLRYTIALLLGMPALTAIPTLTQPSPINCTSTPIFTVPAEGRINPNGIVSGPAGQVVFLISDYENNISSVVRLDSTGEATALGELRETLGVYGYPRWDVDMGGGNLVYTSYVEGDYAIPTTLILMDLDSGEQTTLMNGVNEYDFGREAGLIWWSSRNLSDESSDYGFYIYDPANTSTAALSVPSEMPEEGAFSARLVSVLSNGEILFKVTRFLLDDSNASRISYYRGDPETGQSQLFHQELIEDYSFGFTDATLALEDRIVFISDEGDYSEIDFEGTVLRTVALMGPGYYRDLHSTPTGILFSFVDVDNLEQRGLYHLSHSGVLSALIPDGETLRNQPANILVNTAPDGRTTIWFTVDHSPDRTTGRLYAYQLPDDESIALGDPTVFEDTVDFYGSPGGHFVVASVDQEAVLIDTSSYTQTATGTRFSSRGIYFEGDQAHVVDNGRVIFADSAQGIVYFAAPFLPEDDFDLYAARYGSTDAVQVNPADVNLPFDLHSTWFNVTPDDDILYVANGSKTLFRAHCQPNA